MPSDGPVLLGCVSADGAAVEVWRYADGGVALWGRDGNSGLPVRMSPAARDQLRELLDRAAMPGQVT